MTTGQLPLLRRTGPKTPLQSNFVATCAVCSGTKRLFPVVNDQYGKRDIFSDCEFRVVLVLKSENALIGLTQTIGSWGGSLVGMKKSWSRVLRTIYSFKMKKTGDTSIAWRRRRQMPWGKNSEPLKEFRCSMRTSQICVLWRQITVHFGEEISKWAKQNCKNSFEFRFCFPSYSWVPPSVPSLFTASVLIWSG